MLIRIGSLQYHQDIQNQNINRNVSAFPHLSISLWVTCSPYIQRRVVNLHFGQTFTESDSVCQFLYGLMRSFNPFERFNLLKRETVNWIQLKSQYNNIVVFCLLSDVPSITNWSVSWHSMIPVKLKAYSHNSSLPISSDSRTSTLRPLFLGKKR